MINIIRAKIKEILYKDNTITKFTIENKGKIFECINYNQLTGEVKENDIILLNTTAVELGLGSGGCHFVLANLCKDSHSNIGDGHIMKLRYTPIQINCIAAEAQESPYHMVFNNFESLENIPVIIGTLHSMVAPIALSLKHIANKKRIVYIMTDGGALPIWMSEAVKRLVDSEVLFRTITYGNAFGGDLECINVFTALIAAKDILEADTVLITMGPGIAGTDTKYGFSSIEQSYIIDAVNNLGGKAIAVPRISFADQRSRHYGLSHHSRMTLGRLCCTKACIALPELDKVKGDLIKEQLEDSKITYKHELSYWSCDKVEKLLKKEEYQLEKMGKSFSKDKEYFVTCGLSAFLAT
jgi:hypothetical protein